MSSYSDLVARLRAKPSRDNKPLLTEAADAIEALYHGSASWRRHPNPDIYLHLYCSSCGVGTRRQDIINNDYKYCPRCGAEMEPLRK